MNDVNSFPTFRFDKVFTRIENVRIYSKAQNYTLKKKSIVLIFFKRGLL